MDIKEYAKYVIDNMYRASLPNALNITKQLINLPIQIDKLSGVTMKGNPNAFAKSVRETPNGLSYYFAETNSWVPFYMTERKPTKIYEFPDFLKAINEQASEYLERKQMNFARACTIVALTDKYAKYYIDSYKGQECQLIDGQLYTNEDMPTPITPVEGQRYYDVTKKRSYDYKGSNLINVTVSNYQLHMIIDDFIIDLWECYQNGH